MDRVRIIFFFLSAGLSFFFARGQQIGNYISNGSFEDWTDCNQPNWLYKVKNWGAIDSVSQTGIPFSYCNGLIPNQGNTIYQLPRTGEAFLGSTFFIVYPTSSNRWYIKNRLKTKLQVGTTYCVKFYVNIMGTSPYGNDGFGIYFGDSTIDTITKCLSPLSYLTPQIKCQTNVPVTDTLGWTLITGTFVAAGNEKYAIIGIFVKDAMINTVVTNSSVDTTVIGTDACIDDVSCIPLDIGAYAGPDKLINMGDSVFVGRQPDWAIDQSCIWYKLPNMATSLDTISGLWVKPSITSTYVVRQELDCSPVKWDTVIVSIKIDDTGLDRLRSLSDKIMLAPNPTSGKLTISFSGSVQQDFNSFSITNSLGQIVKQADLTFNNNSADIETSELESGLYQIHFKTQFGTLTKKFVKTSD
jgi:hypothetical protein